MKIVKRIVFVLLLAGYLVSASVSIGLVIFIFHDNKKIYKDFVEVVISNKEPVPLDKEARLRKKITDLAGIGQTGPPPAR